MTNTLKYISKLAKVTRKILFPRSGNSSNPDLDEMNKNIKQVLKVEILYTNIDEFDGCLIWDNNNNRPAIVISRRDWYFRREFTIAHELGHLFLHWKWYPGKNQPNNVNTKKQIKSKSGILGICHYDQVNMKPILYRGKSDSQTSLENDANEFAANLLMPAKGVKSVYKNAPDPDLDSAKMYVSSQFHVSTDAAYHRLYNLKIREEL